MADIRFCIYAVDDDEDDMFFVQQALKPYSDCDVTFFKDGETLLVSLLDSVEKDLPTLILLDLDMPRVSGYEVLTIIRANLTLRAIPILILSSTHNEQIVRRAYELGANSFMKKPDSVVELNELFRATYSYWLKTALTPRNP